jgi:hypothetical protein
MEDQIGSALHQTLGLARSGKVRGEQLDLTGSGCRLLRRNHVRQSQPFDGVASDVPVLDQPVSQLTTYHAGRAQDQDVHEDPLHTGTVSFPSVGTSDTSLSREPRLQHQPRVRHAHPARRLVRVSTPHELMEQYRSAFSRGDMAGLMDCFSFPLQVLSATRAGGSVSIAVAENWPGVLQRLLDAYQSLGVVEAVPLALTIDEPMEPVAIARAHWALLRRDGDSVYDFIAVYTVTRIDGQLRIVAIAHNELPALEAAMRLTSR